MNTPCPWLPCWEPPDTPQGAAPQHAQPARAFYLGSLRNAQRKWVEGKPAQAILFLNKAWSVDLPPDDPVGSDFPPPYAALAWILQSSARGECGFLGNPVRHFQHLASRVHGPLRHLRSWRAWACYHVSRRTLPTAGFEGDGRQLAREGLWIPRAERTVAVLARSGWLGESRLASMWMDPSRGVGSISEPMRLVRCGFDPVGRDAHVSTPIQS